MALQTRMDFQEAPPGKYVKFFDKKKPPFLVTGWLFIFNMTLLGVGIGGRSALAGGTGEDTGSAQAEGKRLIRWK